jgi:hypothetical protein
MRNEKIGPPDQVEAILLAYDHDARAAIGDLVADLNALYRRLAFADACMSSGFSRGWRAIKWQAPEDE